MKFLKWAFRYDHAQWRPVGLFLKFWLFMAAALGLIWFGTMPLR
jgi:hypothetical protein